MRRLYPAALTFLLLVPLAAQESSDSLQIRMPSSEDTIRFNTAQAWIYLDRALRDTLLWSSEYDTLRRDLNRLLVQAREPIDTVNERLATRDFRKVSLTRAEERLVDSVATRWINDSTFLVDPKGWNRDLYMKKKMELIFPVDLSSLTLSDSLLDESGMLDSALFTPDTLWVEVVDTVALKSLEIGLHRMMNGEIVPPLKDPRGRDPRLSSDGRLVRYYHLPAGWQANPSSPFNLVRNPFQLDSLQQAMQVLLEFNDRSDSTLIQLSDLSGRQTPFWIGEGSLKTLRYWVKNTDNDSITLWLGNPGRNQLSLRMEDDLNLSRMTREEIVHLPTFIVEPERSLYEMQMLEPIPIYWDFELNTAMSMSQSLLLNWTAGGESSFATMMDVTGLATYNNKEAKTQWINTARLKFGTIYTKEKGFRKNHDSFELDSKYNRNAWGKIGMSASFYMKQQLAKGYKYPSNDSSVLVSKFLNPGTMTIGLGAEYKPFEKTLINIAPVSYKTTYVLDTATIDPTIHGIPAGQRSKREFGTQVVVQNQISPYKGMEITNTARLFSNYLNNPENIDVDWEITVTQRVNWFFTVRLNIHMIYDDDVRFPVLDENNDPVLNPDGTERKVPKMQLKEFLGLTLSFKF